VKTTSSSRYLILVLISILVFSTFEVVTKTMSGVLSGAQLTFYRFLIGGLFLLPFSIRDMRGRNIKLTAGDVGLLFVFGFLLVFVSMTLAQIGIFYTSASLSAVIFGSNSLFVALFASVFLKERLSKPKMLGLLVGAMGLALTCFDLLASNASSPTFLAGVAVTIVSMLLFCLYTVLSKKWIISKIGPTASTCLVSIFGSLTLVPLVVVQGLSRGENPFYFPIGTVLPQFLYSSIVGTGLAYLFYFSALANLNTSTGAMVFLLKPPLATLLSAIFLHELITGRFVCGVVLILLGLLIALKLKPDALPQNLLRKFRTPARHAGQARSFEQFKKH